MQPVELEHYLRAHIPLSGAMEVSGVSSLLHTRLRDEGLASRLVIQRNAMEYLQPIAGEFTATSSLDAGAWPPFTRMLARKGRARIAVSAVLEHAGQVVGRLTGEFVALGGVPPAAQ